MALMRELMKREITLLKKSGKFVVVLLSLENQPTTEWHNKQYMPVAVRELGSMYVNQLQ